MQYRVTITHKAAKRLDELPPDVKKLFFLLVEEMKVSGPIQKTWRNFSSLGENRYHCHLNYRYVACWTWTKGEIKIEVYYVGNREKAPY
ncbi:MAG TPA: hypothetical protein DCZ95_07130 [Verrucomicrobia bacterium]|nr:MAG: hypothetical protein A2X46_05540 [Lentisphaerae bacterium GWF2_57_35]HBA83848.1 hypothetical protein [Verrucomicrobiota bacterium]